MAVTPPIRPPSTPINDINDKGFLTPFSDPDNHTSLPQSEQALKWTKAVKPMPAKCWKTGSSIATYARKNAIEASFVIWLLPSPSLVLSCFKPYLGPVPCLITRKWLVMDCVEMCHIIPKVIDHATVHIKLPQCVLFMTHHNHSLISLNLCGDSNTWHSTLIHVITQSTISPLLRQCFSSWCFW